MIRNMDAFIVLQASLRKRSGFVNFRKEKELVKRRL